MPSFSFISVSETLLFNPARLRVTWRKENVRERPYKRNFNVAVLLRSPNSFNIPHRLPLEPRPNKNFIRINIEAALHIRTHNQFLACLFLLRSFPHACLQDAERLLSFIEHDRGRFPEHD
jgi:hypothetical protein